MIVARFTSATGWAGRTITYDDGVFTLEGHGAIKARDVQRYGRQEQLEWAGDDTCEWVDRMAAMPELVPGVRWLSPYSGDAQYADVTRQPAPPTKALAGLVLGIVGIIFPLLVFWWIGLPLSWSAYRKAKLEGLPSGVARAGLIINGAGTVLSVVMLLVIVVLVVVT